MADDGVPRSLTQRTLWKVAARISIVVTIATILSYWHVRSGLEGQALEQLEEYVELRRTRESTIFTLAKDNLGGISRMFETRMQAGEVIPPSRFDLLFERRGDGTTRLRRWVFNQSGISGFIGKHVAIDDDLKRRLITAFDLLSQYGPAWRHRLANLYAITPENAILMYWPDQSWALDASDWEIHGKLALVSGGQDEVLVLGEPTPVLEGGDRWSNLYYDYGVNDWLVSATLPVLAGRRHLLSFGHDILLRELIERTVTSSLEGTYNLIANQDGRLIAHPRFMEAIQAQSGTLSIDQTGDPHLARIFEAARTRADDQVVVVNEDDGEFLAVTQLDGPGWYLITVYPREIIALRALDTARLVLILGAIALLLEIGILFMVMKKQVAEPLRSLIQATKRIAAGRFGDHVEVERNDEIGQLAHSFNAMADEIDARERKLSERSAALVEVNAQLAHQLEERERAEIEIARQREALHQSEKLNALGSLLAGVAHELNNPLSVVVGRAGMLEEELRGTPHAGPIAKIRTAADRCAKIVKTFLAMARQQAPSRQAVQIEDVIRATLEVVGYGLRRDEIDVTLDLQPGMPAIAADPNQLTQVLTNLLVNAQQALAGQPPPRCIQVTSAFEPTDQELRVEISDNGPGIPTEILPRIFEPFFTTKAQGQGTGLGLSVCRGLIEAHDGRLDVDLPEEGGTRFLIRLPAVPASTCTPSAVDEEDAPAPSTPARILVVEDEPEIAHMLVEFLKPLGHRIALEHSGRAALERLENERYDLIMTDLRMPDVDGPALFSAIQARDPAQAQRVVFVTGDSLSETAMDFLERSGQPVIEKPFPPEEIRAVVQAQLERLGQTRRRSAAATLAVG